MITHFVTITLNPNTKMIFGRGMQSNLSESSGHWWPYDRGLGDQSAELKSLSKFLKQEMSRNGINPHARINSYQQVNKRQ